METTVDEAGRVSLPAAILQALGLKPGSKLDVESVNHKIVLEPIPGLENLVQEGNIWVHTGVPTGDLLEAEARDREERIEQIMGLKP
ncbi:MAG TPA: AbrB/MazE/SpoVT family DNA-binding domain-containing protein [Planctomycetota bacterium]|jgi:AbrB family looped-hinge helix DNA binding protein